MSQATQPHYPEYSDLLKDRIILITGAGDGIGQAVAIACAKHGATTILSGKTEVKLNHTYDAIVAATDTQPVLYPLDLSSLDDDAANSLAGGIYNEFGRLDGLVHNAALLGSLTPYNQYDSHTWHTVFQVNVHAPFMLSKACLPLLEAARNTHEPSILFTGSGVGQVGKAYWGAYAASKFANEGMMQTLGDELESVGIKVNLIDPGAVRTSMRATAFPAEDPNTLPAPQQITDAYLYLLSKESQGVSKQRFNVWVAPNTEQN